MPLYTDIPEILELLGKLRTMSVTDADMQTTRIHLHLDSAFFKRHQDRRIRDLAIQVSAKWRGACGLPMPIESTSSQASSTPTSLDESVQAALQAPSTPLPLRVAGQAPSTPDTPPSVSIEA